jgi:predicted nicotinamide N-methyase
MSDAETAINPEMLQTALAQVREQVPLHTLPLTIGEHCWQITTATDQSAFSEISQHLDYFPHGLLLWEAAVGLAHWLQNERKVKPSQRVLELGCGVGLPGLVARALGAEVWQTDHLAVALAVAALNAEQNNVAGINYFLADWREWSHSPQYDLILGTDILYARLRHFYLERIFYKNLAPGGSLLLSDPGRPQTLEFVTELEARGWTIELATHTVTALQEPHEPVEISLFECRRHSG